MGDLKCNFTYDDVVIPEALGRELWNLRKTVADQEKELKKLREKVVPIRGTMTTDEINVSLFDECKRLEKGLLGMKPMPDAPKDGTYILLFAPSGYSSVEWRCEVCKFDSEYRPLQPWINHAGDSFTDGGDGPIGWLPMPE